MYTDDPDYMSILAGNRYFPAPAFASAIASLNLADGARVLEIGTHHGGALPLLARAVGTTGSVLSVDGDPSCIALADDCVEQTGIADRVTVRLGDISEVLADAATAPEKAFDAIWAYDVLLSMYFEEPADVARQMAQALRPGGVVAVFYSNFHSSTFLPGHSRLERGLYSASELHLGLAADGPRHKGRHLAWLQAAGFDNISLTIHPRVCFPVDADPTLRPYLEQCVWPHLRKLAANYGAAAGLSTAEVDEIQRLTTPGHPDYIVDEPGYYYVLPATLATGRRPA
jgi:protein-L-isoaspartate O-methyltransferase